MAVMLMVMVVKTANFELLFCARHYSKSFTSINSFTFHKNPMREFLGSTEKMKKLKCTDSLSNSPQGTQLEMAETLAIWLQVTSF